MIQFPIIHYITGNYQITGNKKTRMSKIYQADCILGHYHFEQGRTDIYIVKQPHFKQQEWQTLVHELLHWVVGHFIGNNRRLHGLIDKYLGALNIN